MTKNNLIVDTGFFVALLSNKDQYHQQAISLRKIIDKRVWITTWPVLTEVCHILGARNSGHLAIKLFDVYCKSGFELFSMTKIHIPRTKELLEKYCKLPMDLADASLVILAEELGHGDIVSTDARDFKTYRWKNHKPFNNYFDSFI